MTIVELHYIWVCLKTFFNNDYITNKKFILAPEIIENLPYSQLCDVWALGIIMFILYKLIICFKLFKFKFSFKRLTSHSPFTADTETKLRDQIKRAELDTRSKSYIKLSPEGFY